MATEDHGLKEAAFKKIGDPELLRNYYLSAYSSEAAWKILTGQKDVKEAIRASNDKDLIIHTVQDRRCDTGLRLLALQRLTQADWAALYKSCDEEIRSEIIKNCQDGPLLSQAVLEEHSRQIREMAIERCADQALLQRIAQDRRAPWPVRLAALKRVQNTDILIQLAHEDWNSKMAGLILQRVQDQDRIDGLLQKHIGSLDLSEMKQVKHCPFCKGELAWNESSYNSSLSGPADSFFRETETITTTETIYSVTCLQCKRKLFSLDTKS